MIKKFEQIRSNNRIVILLAVLLSTISSVQGIIEQCRDIYPQYPYFFMLPVYLGKAQLQNKTSHVFNTSGDCFHKISIETTFTFDQPLNGTNKEIRLAKAEIKFNLDEPYSSTCMEHFVVGTAFQDIYDFYLTRGEKFLELEFTEIQHLIDLLTNGLRFFTFCAEHTSIISSVMQTSNLFTGGFGFSKYLPFVGSKLPGYMVSSNSDFIGKFMGKPLEQRVITEVSIDSKLIKDGDLILTRRLDGMDPFYMVSSGSQAGHAAVAMRDNHGELYIIEAQSAYYFKQGQNGVQSTKFSEWIQLAFASDLDVAWIPMKDDIRKTMFNTTKAKAYFQKTVGLPYSHRSQFFSVVDTVEDNYFAPISSELIPFMIRYLQSLYPQTFNLVFREALNKRLGIRDQKEYHQTFEDILVSSFVKRNMTIEQLFTVPENDTWNYTTDGPQGFSSSTYVASLYKAAGIFKGLEINAQEFTVKDLYELDIFKNHTFKSQRPAKCQEADPHIPYCQLLGLYRIELPTLSTVKPYSKMNERCPSRPPLYERPTDC